MFSNYFGFFESEIAKIEEFLSMNGFDPNLGGSLSKIETAQLIQTFCESIEMDLDQEDVEGSDAPDGDEDSFEDDLVLGNLKKPNAGKNKSKSSKRATSPSSSTPSSPLEGHHQVGGRMRSKQRINEHENGMTSFEPASPSSLISSTQLSSSQLKHEDSLSSSSSFSNFPSSSTQSGQSQSLRSSIASYLSASSSLPKGSAVSPPSSPSSSQPTSGSSAYSASLSSLFSSSFPSTATPSSTSQPLSSSASGNPSFLSSSSPSTPLSELARARASPSPSSSAVPLSSSSSVPSTLSDLSSSKLNRENKGIPADVEMALVDDWDTTKEKDPSKKSRDRARSKNLKRKRPRIDDISDEDDDVDDVVSFSSSTNGDGEGGEDDLSLVGEEKMEVAEKKKGDMNGHPKGGEEGKTGEKSQKTHSPSKDKGNEKAGSGSQRQGGSSASTKKPKSDSTPKGDPKARGGQSNRVGTSKAVAAGSFWQCISHYFDPILDEDLSKLSLVSVPGDPYQRKKTRSKIRPKKSKGKKGEGESELGDHNSDEDPEIVRMTGHGDMTQRILASLVHDKDVAIPTLDRPPRAATNASNPPESDDPLAYDLPLILPPTQDSTSPSLGTLESRVKRELLMCGLFSEEEFHPRQEFQNEPYKYIGVPAFGESCCWGVDVCDPVSDENAVTDFPRKKPTKSILYYSDGSDDEGVGGGGKKEKEKEREGEKEKDSGKGEVEMDIDEVGGGGEMGKRAIQRNKEIARASEKIMHVQRQLRDQVVMNNYYRSKLKQLAIGQRQRQVEMEKRMGDWKQAEQNYLKLVKRAPKKRKKK